MNPKMSNRTYDFLKRAAQIYIPALGTLYAAVGAIWHLPDVDHVVATVVAFDTFLGVVLHISSADYNKDAKFDGIFTVDHRDDGGQSLRLLSVDYDALNNKKELTFKFQDPPKQGVAG